MRKQVLDFVVCPRCGGSFHPLETASENEDVVSGTLKCVRCPSEYRIEGGIPYFDPSFDEDTIRNFGYSWKKFSDIYENQKEDFLDWINPVTAEFFRGKTVLDAGAGIGLHSCFASEFGAKTVFAIDLSAAVRVALENCRNRENVHVLQANIYAPPFREESFEYIFSIGVIQHVPEREKAVEKLVSLLKKGGTLSLWVYSDEVGSGLKVFLDILRRATLPLNPKLVYVLSFPWAALFFLVGKIYRVLVKIPLVKKLLPMKEYFLYMSRFPFKYQHNTVYDQLIAPRTYYFKKEELDALFGRLNFKSVLITSRNGMSWRVFAQNRL
jgi:SAM-dependent methyltransferase